MSVSSHAPSGASSAVAAREAAALRQRKRQSAYSFLFVLFLVFITCMAAVAKEKEVPAWKTYIQIVRTILLLLLVTFMLWGYTFIRLTSMWERVGGKGKGKGNTSCSGRCRNPFSFILASLRGGTRRAREVAVDEDAYDASGHGYNNGKGGNHSNVLLAAGPASTSSSSSSSSSAAVDPTPPSLLTSTEVLALFIIAPIYILTCIIVVYPIGGWIHPGFQLREDPPVFIEVGYAGAAILFQLAICTVIADLVYIAYAPIAASCKRSVKKYEAVHGTPEQKAAAAAEAAAEAAAAQARRSAPTLTPTPTPDPEIGVQAMESDIAASYEAANVVETHTKERESKRKASSVARGGCSKAFVRFDLRLQKIEVQVYNVCVRLYRRFGLRPLPVEFSYLAMLAAFALSIWGLVNGQHKPVVMTVELSLPRLPASLDGFRIVMMSDLHTGQTVGARRLRDAVAISNSLNPDIVAISGDLTDSPFEVVSPMLSPLLDLKSKYNRTFFSTGNHDYYYDVITALPVLRSFGLTVLENTIVSLPEGAGPGDSFDFLGVPDWAESVKPGAWVRRDLPGAVEGRNLSRELVVLAHQPFHAKESVKAGAGLQMSGHVHCGQLIPIMLGAYMVMPYFRGLYDVHIEGDASPAVAGAMAAAGRNPSDGWHMFEYQGCGTYGFGPMFRQRAPNEVTLFILRSEAVVGRGRAPKVTCTGIGCGE